MGRGASRAVSGGMSVGLTFFCSVAGCTASVGQLRFLIQMVSVSKVKKRGEFFFFSALLDCWVDGCTRRTASVGRLRFSKLDC